MRVFLTGATGWVGSVIARKLLAMGHGVVDLVRSKEKAEAFASAGGTALLGCLRDLDVLRRGAGNRSWKK
jgi:nucleoside-diphosphate-sugar epimerase